MKRSFGSPLAAILLGSGLVAFGCGDDDHTGPAKIEDYNAVHDWVCASNENCQDVFKIDFEAGTTADFEVTDLTGNSIVQIALYAPYVTLGDYNLFTGSSLEYRCGVSGSCDVMPAESVTGFFINMSGTHHLAVTRNWGSSCGDRGTYRLRISADHGFSRPVLSVDDVASLAQGATCGP
jgi:hypothetical protein